MFRGLSRFHYIQIILVKMNADSQLLQLFDD